MTEPKVVDRSTDQVAFGRLDRNLSSIGGAIDDIRSANESTASFFNILEEPMNNAMNQMCRFPIAITLLLAMWSGDMCAEELTARVTHHEAVNKTDNTTIHYVSIGEGPLVVFVHGFPDYWYSWAHQMERLADDYHCVALDLRGYNRSGKPAGKENYDMGLLVQDVVAVIKACGEEKVTVVGHDWGGAISWTLAMQKPQFVERLVICNLPHPRGLKRELLINDEHRTNTQYARDFQDPDFHKQLTPQIVVTMLKSLTNDEWSETKQNNYLAAFEQSDFNAMLNYYRQNYNPELQEKAELPYVDLEPLVKVKMPVLMFHGLDDKALHPDALNNTWDWVEKDLTLVTLPGAGHWVHHDEAEKVSNMLHDWLKREK